MGYTFPCFGRVQKFEVCDRKRMNHGFKGQPMRSSPPITDQTMKLSCLFGLTGWGCLIHAQPQIEEVMDVADVWSGHRVDYCLLVDEEALYIGYYDADRFLTVAARFPDSDAFQFQKLDQQTGWDSHNFITMALDSSGNLHVSGDMHNDPLVYFRSENPGDIHSLQRIEAMTGEDENRITYPAFLAGPDGIMIFSYRDGDPKDGKQIFNVYSPQTREWSRYFDTPLLDGEGVRNAYSELVAGPDGFFHLLWVWREGYPAELNHSVSYARSRNLRDWENAQGRALALPITLDSNTLVDPVPVRGGVINGGLFVGFDGQSRAVLSYHKFDDDGFTQAFNARFEDGDWKIYQVSDWKYRWWFEGFGSLGPSEVYLSPVGMRADGAMVQRFHHRMYGDGTWILDPYTLDPIRTEAAQPELPDSFFDLQSDFPGMRVNRKRAILAGSPSSEDAYWLRWESLGVNRDQPRVAPLPPASRLQVVKVRTLPKD